MKRSRVNSLVIGSGAAGLCAALRLGELGVESVAVYTEGLEMGTSLNTGSDKQTYYKLGMYGDEPDSPGLMARDLAAGGAVHGDLALVEAALSPLAFGNLVRLGVPFPHDRFGQYIGYKTDHDPRRRATSCGPYTSREMCRALTAAVRERGLPIHERRDAFRLLVDPARSRCLGAVFLDPDTGELEAVQAENCVFAVGGPAGLYENSVYPQAHSGAIGLALEQGAAARNLAESQFGLGAVGVRWNVSGSYMQALPRFVSTDGGGGGGREFLREYFSTPEEMYDAIFLKGYQWPFAVGHVPGSSLIDLFCHVERHERGRRIWLDYRRDAGDLDWGRLGGETRAYLERSEALGGSPCARLEKLNRPALELFRSRGIDLAREPLEVAVCAQHNNGGLAADIWWESENIARLFPVGEVNGSHGVLRPGGAALNAGQVGAFRAAERIAARCRDATPDDGAFESLAAETEADFRRRLDRPADLDWRAERRILQRRMSAVGALVRRAESVRRGLEEARAQLERLRSGGWGGLSPRALAESRRNEHLLLAQVAYLAAIAFQAERIGSRGGGIVLGPSGRPVHPGLPEGWRMVPEDAAQRRRVVKTVVRAGLEVENSFEDCRPVPRCDGWFETEWRRFRRGECHE